MELWASGFNAWGQLEFGEPQLPRTAPRDLRHFKCILKDNDIEVVRTTLSATLVRTSTGLQTAGYQDDIIRYCISKQNSLPNLAIAGNDKVVSLPYLIQDSESSNASGRPEVKLAGANASVLKQYNSVTSYISNDGEKLQLVGGMRMIVANQCTFTALSGAGEVWTWGDGRYEACFGREISAAKPADRPCVVEDLLDLPTGLIRKVSSGGYVTAALTEGNDLYVWGGRPGQPKLLQDLNGAPTPVDLDGEDILDVAVGMNHILALTTGRKLFVAGDGSNGQLGMNAKVLTDWTEVPMCLEYSQQITNVHAGYKNSMIIVENIR